MVLAFLTVGASKSHLVADDTPMLYFFTSRGCAPCIQVKHVVKQLDSEGFPVTTIDVGERPDWANAFRVSHTPTLALVKNNEVIAWQPRPMRAEELRGWFRTIHFTPDSDVARSETKTVSAEAAEVADRVRPTQGKVSLAAPTSVRAKAASFSSATMHRGTRRPSNQVEANALDATVRLQVKDDTGTSYATGTVIHSHEGESLVLTCGHVFRDSNGRGEIVAEIGFEGATVKVPGKLLDYDSDANDIALVSIRNGNHRVSVAEVANASSMVDVNDMVWSIGCDHGEAPTIRHSAIKNLARYDGALKYDIFGRPVNGRSGGGLFNAKGQLIGVCNAAAVEVDEGIYSALETIHWELARTNLDRIFQSSPERTIPSPTDSPTPQRMALASSSAAPKKLAPSRNLVPIGRRSAGRSVAAASPVRNVSFEQPVSSDSDREVIITVRSKSNPSDSRTITISDPTPKLLDYLGGMQGDQSRSLKLAQYREAR
jgi:S1-C subfamily serine protease